MIPKQAIEKAIDMILGMAAKNSDGFDEHTVQSKEGPYLVSQKIWRLDMDAFEVELRAYFDSL